MPFQKQNQVLLSRLFSQSLENADRCRFSFKSPEPVTGAVLVPELYTKRRVPCAPAGLVQRLSLTQRDRAGSRP